MKESNSGGVEGSEGIEADLGVEEAEQFNHRA